MEERIRLGISSCLLGNEVRYDGGHKRERFLVDTLGAYVDYVPVCPEVGCGLGIPREAMRLVGDPAAPRLVTVRTRIDHTDRMLRWAREAVTELGKENLCGFVLKSKSPSSGMERVKVYSEQGMPAKNGVGLFARAFMDHFPLIPVEEDGRLHDPALRENFIERIFVMQRWRDLLARPRTVGRLVAFHARHKLLFHAHSEKHAREMGRLVAGAKEIPPEERYVRYKQLMMAAMKLRATVRKHVNVLMHMLGHLKKRLSSDEKQECLEVLQLYRDGHVPLIVPATLLNHYVRKYREPYLAEQIYLRPHPIELHLRNHA